MNDNTKKIKMDVNIDNVDDIFSSSYSSIPDNPSCTQCTTAMSTWELENNVVVTNDDLFQYNKKAHDNIVKSKPWVKDPHHYKYVRVSAVALLKMVLHARSGGNLEIMGMLIGKVTLETFIIIDVVPLPVEGTETRVNAQAEAYEYIAEYMETVKKIGRMENVIGWYHSHPGYGCWLSGIDVATQHLNQTYTDPWVAVVIDPVKTISSGQVNLGAFRTFPANYKAKDEEPSIYQSIPLSKIEDFGVHVRQYYPLKVSYFKSTADKHLLEILWNRYWSTTLSNASNILSQPQYMTGLTRDLAEKIANAERLISKTNQNRDKIVEQTKKCSKDAAKLVTEQLQGLMGQMIKYSVFNSFP